ncbi:hypothetical protein BMS3Abin07_00315 [bacterium BMS3Abin07]|nr:hypothetical protein BMS3Abin07_00315 [bacterium BMS3Abin07]GBE31780.1 hypothetical protein BMS3Bbin05_00683 [bacterium BMS3Bbin05]
MRESYEAGCSFFVSVFISFFQNFFYLYVIRRNSNREVIVDVSGKRCNPYQVW